MSKKQNAAVVAPPEEWISVPAAAKQLEVHEVTFRRWISEGKVRVKRTTSPRRVQVSLTWLKEIVADRELSIVDPK